MKLHHRVTVKPSRLFGLRVWYWACPACDMVSRAERHLHRVHALATDHAHDCHHLYRLNRQTAWPCHNCGNSGRVCGMECPCCLGKGYAA